MHWTSSPLPPTNLGLPPTQVNGGAMNGSVQNAHMHSSHASLRNDRAHHVKRPHFRTFTYIYFKYRAKGNANDMP